MDSSELLRYTGFPFCFADNVFVAGDAANGASLVVRAMASGRKIAAQVDKYLNK